MRSTPTTKMGAPTKSKALTEITTRTKAAAKQRQLPKNTIPTRTKTLTKDHPNKGDCCSQSAPNFQRRIPTAELKVHLRENPNDAVILHPCFRQEFSPVLHLWWHIHHPFSVGMIAVTVPNTGLVALMQLLSGEVPRCYFQHALIDRSGVL